MTDKDAGAALAEVIGGGVVPRSELDERLAEAGHRISANQIDRQIQMDTRFFEMGDSVGYVPGLTEGVAFSMWVDPATAADDFLVTHPALALLSWWLMECPIDVFDETGTRIGSIEGDGWLIEEVDTDVVVGPAGWLEEYGDTWVAFRVRQEALVIERLTGPPSVDPARAAAVRSAFDTVAEHHHYEPVGGGELIDVVREELSMVLQQALNVDGPVFAGVPLPATADLLEAAGLRTEGYWVVPADLDDEVYAAATTEWMYMARWGVDAEHARAGQLLLGAIHKHGQDGSVDFESDPERSSGVPDLFESVLQHEGVARAIAYECSNEESCKAAKAFGESVAALLEDDPDAWAMRWLVAHCNLVLGDVDSAAVVLDDLPSGLDHLPVLVDRARVAIARSQAKEAQKLLRAAERQVDDLPELTVLSHSFQRLIDELLEEVEVWADNTPPPMARRNERCPCGSGRKYKVCHLGHELHPIGERSLWLYHKMVRFAREQEAEEIESLAWVMSDAMDTPRRWTEMVDAPLIPDLVLHEEGVEQRFLDGGMVNLPDDEILLAQQWMLVDRSVFEVESTGPGVLGLRDLPTGEEIEVGNVEDRLSRPGSILIGRPLPVGDTYRAFSGFMALRPDLVRSALSVLDDKDPDGLLELLGGVLRAPTIRNTDGQQMGPTEITWSLPDGSDVTGALSRAGLTDAGGSWTLVRDTANQSNAMIASLQVDGDTMVGSVNSVERAGELLELIAEHLPEAVHINTEVLDFNDVDETDVPALPDQAELLANPEIRAAMEAHMANYEEEWLDSPIPALDGRTPRDAAADPIAREDLVRLLASFPEVDDGGVGMSPGRLRAALGLGG